MSSLEVRQSSVLRRTAQTDGRVVYVKQYLTDGHVRTVDVVRARTEREADLCARLALLPQMVGRLGVPKVVELDSERGVIVTAEVPGRPLEEWLLAEYRRPRSSADLRSLFLAGRWLRAFQSVPVNVGDTASLTSDLEDLVGYCSQRLGALSTAGWRPPPGWTVDRILDRLRAMQDASGEEVHARAWCHGDFGPSNILWDGQVITGIDLGIAHIGHPLADATYFIHRVEMLALSFPWKRWPVARWRGAFLRGFGRPDVEGQALYNALMARHLLCRLASLYRRPGHSWKQRLHVTWLRPRIAAELTRVLSDANNRPLR